MLVADPEVKVLEHTEYDIDDEEALKEAADYIEAQGMPSDVNLVVKCMMLLSIE